MSSVFIDLTYLLASILFIFGIKGLTHPRTAVRGNLLGATGMLLAVVATLADRQVLGAGTQELALILAGVLLGSVIGVTLALKIQMTAMPQMVALLNDVFSEFDSITIRHGVEKISTSGDNYLVASGVPEPRPDHAQALVNVALDMRDYLASRNGELGGGCRCGLASIQARP